MVQKYLEKGTKADVFKHVMSAKNTLILQTWSLSVCWHLPFLFWLCTFLHLLFKKTSDFILIQWLQLFKNFIDIFDYSGLLS